MQTATRDARDDQMREVHDRMQAAVNRSTARGVDEFVAFQRHMTAMASEYPTVFASYAAWLNRNA
jgi:hypothetical protein